MENDVRVTVTGWVCSEPQVRSGPNGDFLAFRVGSTPRFRRVDGDYTDLRTEWFDVKVRSVALINNVRQSVRRSDPVMVVGRLSSQEWEAKDGVKHWAMQIQAEVVGHDLRWGDTRFTKVPMAQHRRASTGQAGEETAQGEPLAATEGLATSQFVEGAADLPLADLTFEAPPDFENSAEQATAGEVVMA